MTFGWAMLGCLCLIAVTRRPWQRLQNHVGARRGHGWSAWLMKGLLVPTGLWVLLNTGWLFGAPLFGSALAFALASGGRAWVPVLLEMSAPAIVVITSSWSGITVGWLAVELVWRGGDRRRVWRRVLFWSIGLSPLLVVIFKLAGFWGSGLALTVWLLPIVRGLPDRVRRRPAASSYARALVKLRQGQSNQAEWEIISALEKCEDDFEGWMMLAGLYADEFHDMAAAEQTVQDMCAQPDITQAQIALALNRLADWYLKHAKNVAAARRVLGQIVQRLPRTHAARLAQFRLNELPASREELRERRTIQMLFPSASSDDIIGAATAGPPGLSSAEANALANHYVERLQHSPDDVTTREEYARLLADCLDSAALAVEQVEFLLTLPGQTAWRRAEWLALIATWQLRHLRNRQAARQVLTQLVREYPLMRQASAAQRRLCIMDLEDKIRREEGDPDR